MATLQGVAEQAGRQEVAGRVAACGECVLGVLLARWRRRLALQSAGPACWVAGLHSARLHR